MGQALTRWLRGPADLRLWGLVAAVLFSLTHTWMLATHRIALGSPEGRWVYPQVDEATLQLWVAALAATALAVVLLRVTSRLPREREFLALLVLLIGGFAIQLTLRLGAPASLEALVTSDRASSFYSPSLRYGPVELLRQHEAIRPGLPLHARSNMPGKVIFFHFLGLFSDSPRGLGLLVVGFSNLGAILLYVLVQEIADDRRAALFAAMLYLVMPGKLVFFPVLNTVSPVLILLALWTHARALRTGSRLEASLLGLSLYALLFFEPLPLVMGPVFAALLGGALARGGLSPRRACILGLHCVATFAAVHLLMLAIFRYNVLADFLRLLEEAHDFNVRAGRPYSIWVGRNLCDFAFCAGTASAALTLIAAADLLRPRHGRALRDRMMEPQALVTLSLMGVLLILDLLGINRGEVVRLWIFLAAAFQMVPAFLCARLPRLAPFEAVVASAILQGAVAASTVGFALP